MNADHEFPFTSTLPIAKKGLKCPRIRREKSGWYVGLFWNPGGFNISDSSDEAVFSVSSLLLDRQFQPQFYFKRPGFRKWACWPEISQSFNVMRFSNLFREVNESSFSSVENWKKCIWKNSKVMADCDFSNLGSFWVWIFDRPLFWSDFVPFLFWKVCKEVSYYVERI